MSNGKYEIIKKPYIEIGSIEELVDFIKDVDNEVIVGEDNIMIYDGYIE